MESLPEEEQELSALHCNPDMGLVMTQVLIFLQAETRAWSPGEFGAHQ